MKRSAVLLPVALLALLPVAAACGDETEASPATAPVTAAATAPQATSPITVVTPAEGAALMDQMGSALTVIDVRTPEEFAAGHIAGAVNMDVEGGQFTSMIAGLDHSTAYMVYCHSGRRSAMAAEAMAQDGFTTVYDLGGLQAWVDAGYPITA